MKVHTPGEKVPGAFRITFARPAERRFRPPKLRREAISGAERAGEGDSVRAEGEARRTLAGTADERDRLAGMAGQRDRGDIAALPQRGPAIAQRTYPHGREAEGRGRIGGGGLEQAEAFGLAVHLPG